MSPLFDKAAAMLKLSPEAVETWRERLRPRAPDGLSARLLLLTVAFTLAVEALIMGPNLAAFHERWLRDRLQAAELASVGVEALPYSAVEDDTAAELMRIGGVQAVALTEQGVRRLLLQAPNLPRAPELIDLRQQNSWARLTDPWRTLFGHPDRSLRVQAKPRYRSGDFIEIVTPAQPLKLELKSFLLNSLLVSLLVSVTAGALLYGGLALLVLRPLRRVTRSMERFAADPESEAEPPSDRHDEIGRVERELSRMQEEVRQSLRSRARLVALGEAVAKINHDLRNMLTSAQMASERLATSADPQVAKALPRLERALSRAAGLSRNVLEYGRSEEPAPQKTRVVLTKALTVAAEDAGLEPDGVRLVKQLPARFAVEADPDQLYRILVNLMRNARQAIEADGGRPPERRGRGAVTVSAFGEDGVCVVRIADDGPGIPPRLAERLFEPFVSSKSSDGSGLGLTISRELAALHGGDLRLVPGEGANEGSGAVFELRLPA
ncbi:MULTISPECIES: HAMP domain-containing sensor histidine kinase [Brevundimonas]|jgi:signal transduction histidine kinase|uniref:histidine kinase n=1 Tax=Brevundimonas mediterranea TaxID=74329 RepID=A0AB37E6R4_9CAUL|nr:MULTISPECIES: HAMP domain-containing sensor histidine kinase [Brevundimonas]OGN45678.1 MAG: histidine kinase [Caulobacterales bacterium RIFCSPHIGHO2_12_FULL_68_13]EDX80964.1 ATPase, histidine kinase-, DNA gyrase B-, and HSP90-like domain protein [Brevundimonas sp. BAL3]MBA4330588.1 sensor histidine kinase [Brevundimonas sp.]QIH72675.1 HAMP domain-containing histidine kinase [Brevundimonas mediterranea]TAJ43105.1 MAG: HAMP domain-containing histidine kinase [Brevundimonas sp.]